VHLIGIMVQKGDYYVNLLRSIMVSLVMQALEGKNTGFSRKIMSVFGQ
jgi:hypothetical protein